MSKHGMNPNGRLPELVSRTLVIATRAAAAFVVAVSAIAPVAMHAQSGIVPSRENGRVIFVNNDTPTPAANSAPSALSTKRLVYWSNVEHRWKPVPRPTRRAMRNARSAVREIEAMVAKSSPTVENAAAPNLTAASPNPEMQAPTYGHKISQQAIDAAIDAAARRHNVNANLVRAIIQVESNFNPRAVSRKGAMGLMQLMPSTARQLNVRNPFDPSQNIDGGVRHFKGLLDNFGGNVPLSLAAYNAGQGAVSRNRGVPPYAETRKYVHRITQLYGGGASPLQVLQGTEAAPIRITRDSEGHMMFTND